MDLQHTLKFLQKLSKNNNRAWFEKNKGQYLQVKDDFDAFLAALLKELITVDEGLASLNPKKLAFRIYRDVRFSKDKSPYKSNLGAGFSRNGKMIQEPGYYLHLQPGNKSFLAGGFWQPDPANLAKIRQEIDYNTDRFLKILQDRKFKKTFSGLDEEDKLKTAPKGYPKEHPQIEIMKNRSFIVSHSFSDAEVLDRKFVKKVGVTASALKPLNDFLNQAIAH